ncbi:MAG: sensor histidine kinase [Gemmatimonadota bacterium]
MRDGRLKALALGFACYTLLAAVFALQKVAIFSARGDRAGRDAILLTFLGIYTWGALTPAIFWTSRRFPLGPERSRGNLSAHLVAMLVLVVTDMLVYTALDQFVVPGFRWGGDPPSFAQELRLLLAWGAAGEVLWYVGVTALAHALLYRGMSLERELEAARVETRLAQARVQLLKMQLQPHFLFNTLHAISALVRDEATAARRMLSRLGDLLRLTLDHDGRATVSLTEELEMLEAYLEIQLARFPDRLVVDWDVAADALAAKVPNMLLQPIVENAVRHGIGRRNGEGRIEVRARRRQGRLELQVRDNGAGLPGGTRRLKEGIGLANTRARLRELYGPDHRLDLVNAEGGGLSVRLEIPFRTPSTPGPLRRAVRLPAELEHELPQRLVFVPAHPAVWAVIPIVWVTVLVGQALFLTGPMGQTVETARLVELGSQSLAWTLFTVGILGLCTRFPLGRGDRRRHLAVHLAANVLVLGGLEALLLAVHGALGGSPPTSRAAPGSGRARCGSHSRSSRTR